MAGPRGRSSRFSYYGRLSAAEKRTYRKSDEVGAVVLPKPSALVPMAERLKVALAAGKRANIERAARELCLGITLSLGVPAVRVCVRSVRPSDHSGELHGLYTWEEGEVPVIEVWMRTAKNRRVVQFRTFLRTLLHEVCHHLDFTLLGFSATFHTTGFFRRESSLMRQLAGKRERKPRAERPAPAKDAEQLELFAPPPAGRGPAARTS
ncbi:MAG TPA: hypothetical protein VHC69_15560 [Polyangiaceae bacterium]|nr:hypothetical protein [Polyangiaceae bacterium]